MGDVVVKIKNENFTCELGKPVYSSNVKTPKFECKINGIIIQGSGDIQTLLNSLETALNDSDAAGKGVQVNEFYILQEGTDVGFPGQLQKRLT